MRYQFLFLLFAVSSSLSSQVEKIKFGDFESWITRDIKESFLVGGQHKTLYEVGPKQHIEGNKAFVNQGGCPWANSNVMAKVCGVVKTNVCVYPDDHNGGKCVKMCTQLVSCKAVGVVNITVLAGGSMFLGEMLEPITNSKNPMSKMDLGIPFAKRPKAIRFDYKFVTPGSPNRIRETGFSKRGEVAGPDYGEVTCLLQKRWEDEKGNLHAKRVATMKLRFTKSTSGWVEGKDYPFHYGNITGESYYRSWMKLVDDDHVYYSRNSKGKNVPCPEEGWAEADETPTHVILKFDSSHGEAYVGTVGNTLWIDNVAFVY
ncbi:MAG: PCMD domain-containing protein [Bacteroidaceae bacterium]|nr:PCMD domain-containing protein [Bacteroidaceae bacterium]